MRKNYRKVWESHHGPIPAGYEIHHIDGDKTNDSIENLMCVSLQEHYDIHLAQGDYWEASMIAHRMKMDPEEVQALRTKAVRQRVKDGTHNWLRDHNGETVRQAQLEKFAEGTHHWQTEEHEEKRLAGYHASVNQRKEDGTYHLYDLNKRVIAEGKHTSQRKVGCLGCHRVVDVSNFGRWHGGCI